MTYAFMKPLRAASVVSGLRGPLSAGPDTRTSAQALYEDLSSVLPAAAAHALVDHLQGAVEEAAHAAAKKVVVQGVLASAAITLVLLLILK